MKRHFVLTICLVMLGMVQAAAQTTKVALSHEGNITLFNANELQKALDASVDGDTLYLNEGTYTGSIINIDKKVSLIGAGEKTIISGQVNISATGDLAARMLDGLNIQAYIVVMNPVNNLMIRKCRFTGFAPHAAINNSLIDRCFQTRISTNEVPYFNLPSSANDLRIVNSQINYLKGYSENVNDIVFVNCGINTISNTTIATFINSVVKNSQYTDYSLFSYCYLLSSSVPENEQNCTYAGNSNTIRTDYTPDMLGSDGTPVGIYGGATPYTLEPNIPVVKDFELKVNTTTKKLNVTVNVESK